MSERNLPLRRAEKASAGFPWHLLLFVVLCSCATQHQVTVMGVKLNSATGNVRAESADQPSCTTPVDAEDDNAPIRAYTTVVRIAEIDVSEVHPRILHQQIAAIPLGWVSESQAVNDIAIESLSNGIWKSAYTLPEVLTYMIEGQGIIRVPQQRIIVALPKGPSDAPLSEPLRLRRNGLTIPIQ